jgi:hypothetical protein
MLTGGIWSRVVKVNGGGCFSSLLLLEGVLLKGLVAHGLCC